MTTPAWASGVCAGIHAAGSRDVVYVPDNPLSHVLRELDHQFHDIRRVLATREEEAFASAKAEAPEARRRPPQGAAVIIAKVRESAPTAKPPNDCVLLKQRFMSAIRPSRASGRPEPVEGRNPESAIPGAAP